MFVLCSGRVLSLETSRHGTVYTACPWSQHDERRVRFVYFLAYENVCQWHTVVCLRWSRCSSDSSSFSRHQTGARSVGQLLRTIWAMLVQVFCSFHTLHTWIPRQKWVFLCAFLR